ncbi:MAG: 4-(cytidine 5'-diphospho)-2-C-methyl-D-erythritol kinase [Solirubrobacteraceae bacterium]
MSALRACAPAKVNLCLLLGHPRPDGLHELVSVLWSVSLADELELAPAPPGAPVDELECAGVEGRNLAGDALEAFRRATGWAAPPQRLTIVKRIPVAAGMGGGSADAAATLRLAARAADGDAAAVLARLAPLLGADVPSQLEPGAVLVTGAGERVRRLPPPPPHGLLVAVLPEQLATSAVFAQADRMGLPRGPGEVAERLAELETVLDQEGRLPPELMVNDLEPAARSLCPAIDPALEAVRAHGAAATLVTGSGPTVIGVYPGADGPRRAREAAQRLRGRFPLACAASAVDAGFGAPRPVGLSA